jgi:2-polyprenyl-3-methyl-5-hydroxy-6-metoxy-1,4-benzoquinol methylase
MNKFQKFVEKLIYSFGFNGSFYNIAKEIEVLKQNLPANYLHREIVDIGCGDGSISLKLIPILQPKSFIGIDLYSSLVKRASAKGLTALVKDAENDPLTGDLGILWGVLHHFTNPVATLQKLNREFRSLIIRESINPSRLWELGHKFDKQQLLKVFEKAKITPTKILDTQEKSLIIFIN